MQAQDTPILRGAALPTLVIGGLLVVLFTILSGVDGLVGSLIGLAVVMLFFSLSWIVVSKASEHGPAMMMGAAFGTYLVKIILLGVLLLALRDTTAFDFRAMAWTVLVGVIVWTVFQVRAFIKQRVLYVEPTPSGSGTENPGGAV